MRPFRRILIIVAAALAVPLLPFLIWGATVEGRLEAWLLSHTTTSETVAFVVAALAVDIVLPVPSSLISTVGGARLGTIAGTLVSWLGLTIGGLAGFALADRFGQAWAARRVGDDDFARLRDTAQRHGPWLIAALRPLPLLAEASVLVCGASGLGWTRFLPALSLANLGIAVVYSAFGDWAVEFETLPVALAASVAAPLAATLVMRQWLAWRAAARPRT